jgi:hypothetical protein
METKTSISRRVSSLERKDGDIEREVVLQKGRLGPMAWLALIFTQATIELSVISPSYR